MTVSKFDTNMVRPVKMSRPNCGDSTDLSRLFETLDKDYEELSLTSKVRKLKGTGFESTLFSQYLGESEPSFHGFMYAFDQFTKQFSKT